MRVIFVGVHNKTGLSPLCSTTKSGKLIDRIISSIECECVKTNLYNIEVLPPTKKAKFKMAQDWHFRILPSYDDIIVLLGGEVFKNFIEDEENTPIVLHHPASVWSNEKKNKYVESAVEKITQKC